MASYHFQLSMADGTVIENPTVEEIDRRLLTLSDESNGHAILERSDGSYVQTATTRGGLIAEYRELCRRGIGSTLLRMIGINRRPHVHWTFGSPSSAPGQAATHREANHMHDSPLTVDDVSRLFRSFVNTGTIPSEFPRRDITDMLR